MKVNLGFEEENLEIKFEKEMIKESVGTSWDFAKNILQKTL